MKKLLLLLICVLMSVSAFAQQDELKFDVDAGGFLSYGVIDATSDDEIGELTGIFATLFSIRGGFSVTGRYKITDDLSVGAEIGYATMSIEDSVGNEVVFTDIPLSAVIRYGAGSTFIEGQAGYYVSDTIYGGLSAGAKLSLGGFYVSGAYVLNDTLGNYPRITIGYQFNNLLANFL